MLTTGTYFDGLSSVPRHIELCLEHLPETVVTFTLDNKVWVKWSINEIQIEHLGNSLEIRHKTERLAFIKVTDEAFIKELISCLSKTGKIGWYYKLLHMGMKAYIVIAICILAGIVGGYLVFIPWIAEKAVLIIPEKYDAVLANKYLTQYMPDNEVDSAKSLILNKFASQLKLENNKPLHFTVLKSTIVNAYALPDGNIIVYTGLLNLMTDYNELACLIGHEVIHVNNRHSMKMLCRNLSGYIFISVMLSDVNGVMAVIADNAHNLQSLSYSRKFEQEADEQGTQLMISNNINPLGMTLLFSRLKSQDKGTVPAFISTHPMTNNRIDDINNLIKQTKHKSLYNAQLEELFSQLKANN